MFSAPIQLHAPLLDGISSLYSVGLQGWIQTTRDVTQAALPQAVPILASVLLSSGAAAWTAGSSFRSRAGVAQLGERELGLLVACLLIDVLGDCSFALGEAGDLAWAPLSALLVNVLFGSVPLAALDFAKEIVPLADVLPVATLGWLLLVAFPGAALTSLLGIEPLEDDPGARLGE